jgi:hypothetical protein
MNAETKDALLITASASAASAMPRSGKDWGG